MKILYAVQATGNGHISRAHQIFPHLKKYGDVDILLSGSNATLELDIPVTYRSKGLSLFYSLCGGLDYNRTWKNINLIEVKRDIKDLPVEKYDLILNDFDYITARACKKKKVPSIHFGHQASFISTNTPRPTKKSFLGEIILKHYAPADKHIGLHFEKYDDFIFPPIIKQEIIDSIPKNHGHITVYLPAYEPHCIEKILNFIAPIEVHWFLPSVNHPYKKNNIHYYPVNQKYFNESLIHCSGLMTGGGFETPSEALFLGKKLLAIPIEGQYEQQCNAEALKKFGIKTLKRLDEKTKTEFFTWVYASQDYKRLEANNITTTLNSIVNG